ncbi:MAG: Endoglucanase precursor [Firmicutes bacterium ADurb.Bin456]|nr:MAG: Endoglucanase precursor [Firmicutes bacterium ADurb.Bin456]
MLVKEKEGEPGTVTPDEPAPSQLFSDVPATHWAAGTIKELSETGCISGYPNGTFKPENKITRAEFAVVLAKAYKMEIAAGKVFGDTAVHWARDYISSAHAAGVISGYDDNSFGPDDPITREQMSVLIAKAAKLPLVEETSQFADSGSISSWAGEAVAAAAVNGIINGYPDNTFRPQGNATRAEAVTVIVRALKK